MTEIYHTVITIEFDFEVLDGNDAREYDLFTVLADEVMMESNAFMSSETKRVI